MKTIKIKIADHQPGQPSLYGLFIIERLKQFYDVELSDDPDYIFYHERDFSYLKYPKAIRIMYTGENIHPNLNLSDYSISFDFDSYAGRNFRLPLYLVPWQHHEYMRAQGEDPDFEKAKPMTQKELSGKTGFCSFVYGNGRADPRRLEFFEALSEYKKVDSAGSLRNNIGRVVSVSEKVSFESKYKFSIAFENSSREGYVTEKLPSTLAARTIPIYFGDPSINREFNTKRFVNIHDYPSVEAVIERVKELDENDEEYLNTVNQPILALDHHPQNVRTEFDAFLQSIFDKPIADARKIKINSTHKKEIEDKENLYSIFIAGKNLCRPFMTPVKKIILSVYSLLTR